MNLFPEFFEKQNDTKKLAHVKKESTMNKSCPKYYIIINTNVLSPEEVKTICGPHNKPLDKLNGLWSYYATGATLPSDRIILFNEETREPLGVLLGFLNMLRSKGAIVGWGEKRETPFSINDSQEPLESESEHVLYSRDYWANLQAKEAVKKMLTEDELLKETKNVVIGSRDPEFIKAVRERFLHEAAKSLVHAEMLHRAMVGMNKNG